MERRRVYRRLAIVSSALSVLLASQVPGRFFVCFIRFCASGPLPDRSEAQVQLGVTLGPILGRFWGPFGVHFGVRLEAIFGPKCDQRQFESHTFDIMET